MWAHLRGTLETEIEEFCLDTTIKKIVGMEIMWLEPFVSWRPENSLHKKKDKLNQARVDKRLTRGVPVGRNNDWLDVMWKQFQASV